MVNPATNTPPEKSQQPSARWCFVCGVENPFGLRIRFFSTGHHQVRAEVTFGDEYQSYPGMTHGGILATILDETMGRAVLASDEDPAQAPRFMVTAKMDLRYKLPVPLGQPVIVRGWVESDRGRMANVRGEVLLPDGQVAVEGSAMLVDIPAQQIDQMKNEAGGWEALGWKVYP